MRMRGLWRTSRWDMLEVESQLPAIDSAGRMPASQTKGNVNPCQSEDWRYRSEDKIEGQSKAPGARASGWRLVMGLGVLSLA